jgi:hypothetical protein
MSQIDLQDPNTFHIAICAFCKKELENPLYFPGNCDCAEYTKAHEDWLTAYRASEDYVPPMEDEEFEEEYPLICRGGSGKMRIEARKYKDGVGVCVWQPFESEGTTDLEDNDAGLCWDFGDEDLDDLIGLLQDVKNTLSKE